MEARNTKPRRAGRGFAKLSYVMYPVLLVYSIGMTAAIVVAPYAPSVLNGILAVLAIFGGQP